jgi:hypothetical protein
MRFDANRLARLAGLEQGSRSNVLTEGRNSRLQEVQNQRERDEYGEEGDYGDEMLSETYPDDDQVLEISEPMLRSEIRRMKNLRLNESRRRRQMDETKLRRSIRNEINEIFEDLQLTSKWIYGKNIPRRSSPGKVTMGAPGIGFKGFQS